MKLRTKFLLQILLTVVIIFALFTIYLTHNYTKFTTRLTYTLTNLYSEQIAKSIESNLKSDLRSIETIKQLIEYHISRNGTIDKQYILDLLSAILISNPHYLASWISLELNFLDPSWSQRHGRVRYIVKLDRGIINYYVDTLDVDKEQTDGAYYMMKLGRYSSLIMDPYYYTYLLTDTFSSYLETSLGLPLFYNDKFIGLEGIDISLNELKNLIEISTPFKDSYAFLVSTNGDIAAHSNNAYLAKKLTLIYPELEKYNVLDSISKGKKFSLNVSLGKEGAEFHVAFTPIIVADKDLPWSLVYVVPISHVMQQVNKRLRNSIALSLIALLFLVVIIWVFIAEISKKIERATNILKAVSVGNINESFKLKVVGKDEISDMYKYLNQLIDNLNSTVNFALKIGEGNLDVNYELKSESDKLGRALIEMKESLKRLRREEIKRQKETERANWLQNGITEINEILRTYSNDLDNLSFEVIKFLVRYLKATQGGFYIIIEKEKGKDKFNKVIKLQVAYAYDRKKHLEAEFDIREGLLGRVVQEKRLVKQKVPQGYVFITSGLGGETPNNLIIVPLLFEEEVYGLIEILSFKEFDDYQVEFLSQIGHRVASSLYNILSSLELQNLLQNYEKQQQEIKLKEEELQKKTTELLKKEKEMEQFRLKYERFFSALDATFEHIEYSADFKIKYVNEYFTNILGVARNSILGKYITDLIPELKENQKWFEKFKEDLRKGMVRHRKTKYTIGVKEVAFEETYIPLFNIEGHLDTVVCLGVNIGRFNININE